MTWQRRPVLVGTGLLLAAFGLGVAVGARFGQRPIVYRDVPLPQISTGASSEPASGMPPPCADIRNASTLEGKNGCIAGLVLRVYTAASGNSFLDFCEDYRACPFTSVIFAADKSKFGDVGSLQGKRVEIRGDVVAYQGRAEIILHDPQQVRSAP
jgi:hypothetical protein